VVASGRTSDWRPDVAAAPAGVQQQRCTSPWPRRDSACRAAAEARARARRAFPVWAAMGVLHLGLGLALKLYVFQYWKI